MRTALLLACLAVLAPSARGADAYAPLRQRVREALTALDAGEADRAVTLLQDLAQTGDAGAGDATVQYDLGVAFSRAGRPNEARAAYRAALAAPGGDRHTESVRAAALYNLGTSHLRDAHAAAELLRDPERLAATVAGSAAPGGGPMSPEGQADLLRGIRATTAQKGLSHAKDAITALRDRVRASPADRDAAHNLQVAQRLRRFLEEQLEENRQDDPEESSDDAEKSGEEDGEEDKKPSDEQDGDDSSQENPSGGEQGEQDGDQPESDGAESGEQQPTAGQDEGNESASGDDESGDEKPPEQEGAAGSGEEKKDDPLADMLEAAARRMRLVEEMRRSKMRKVKVEKDW